MSEDRINSLVLSFYVDDLRANGKAQLMEKLIYKRLRYRTKAKSQRGSFRFLEQ